MSKKKSIIKLCVVGVVVLLGLFLTFFSFVIPTTKTTFKGFFNAIDFGYDVDGGVLAVYEPDGEILVESEKNKRLDNTVTKLSAALTKYGFDVSRQDDTIRLEISNAGYLELNNKFSNYGINVFSLVGSEDGLTFSSDSSDGKKEGYVSGEYVSNCESGYSQSAGVYYVTVNFTEEGQTKFRELTQKISDDSGKLYLYINGSVYNSDGFEIDGAVSSLTLTATNQVAAEAMTVQINTVAKEITLKEVVANTVSAGLNTSTDAFFGNEKTLLIVGLVLTFVGILTFLSIRYRVFGLMTGIASLIFIIIYSFLIQSIPLAKMNFNGIIGGIFAYLLLIAGFVSCLEKVRSEYKLGKKIPASLNSGFKKNFLPILEKYVFLILICAVLYIVGPVSLKYFAVSLFVGLFVNYFVIFLLKGLCNTCLGITAKKEFYNLKREAVKNED